MPPETVTTQHVTSADGTRIGYLVQGSGPGIALVQGAMADVHAYRRLAEALAASHTVVSVERRGRGLSPREYDPGHDIARDVEDLEAVLAATGADTVFGLSSGAVITLEAALTSPLVRRAIVYEPPFYRDGIDRRAMDRLFDDIRRDDLAAGLIGALVTAGTAPALLSRSPRFLTRLAARFVLAVDDRRHGDAEPFRALIPGVRFDFHDVAGMDGRMPRLAGIEKPVLLLGGSKSPAFLTEALDDLEATLPSTRRVTLERLGHDGPWNVGGTAAVAAAIEEFLEQTGPV